MDGIVRILEKGIEIAGCERLPTHDTRMDQEAARPVSRPALVGWVHLRDVRMPGMRTPSLVLVTCCALFRVGKTLPHSAHLDETEESHNRLLIMITEHFLPCVCITSGTDEAAKPNHPRESMGCDVLCRPQRCLVPAAPCLPSETKKLVCI
ncbi:hypothetical protein CALVIDRAFT_392861 [Calocera viscosa TUFC12733]|uniref:Uncharacterized protein n=1 Tax=Calocera viscosa (strain TUFC12733) TaxID=1330018 RepID=A0A167GEB9_CALVF|nr:hypothetical protein CALVIDRAFT_392861 [Calocera viscosa TUFC12733]